ncbi:peptidase domain-containing ABC transporter [Thalassotalea euphylliae]|uniref:Peptidase domain-containing ABC transporter n=1 Tax=Thalassotalea euphylliae TaxID=1655234 RepID=A0A3E0TNA1_9GAMM|nr:peptidase domain-containing ABC transporter [Thalassotalea euphylliae]REL25592.1 peptidase domain-containing ABC transporter [Thalassotalea euphylliae]
MNRLLHEWPPTKKIPLILQAEIAECGLACLAMISSYFGKKIDLTTLRRNCKVSATGSSLKDLVYFSGQLSLSSRALKVELKDLKHFKHPCILHWDLSHFVVLKSANDKHVVVHDPAFGERTLTLEDVSEHFTGIALELTPTKTFIKEDKTRRLRPSDFWSKITGLTKSIALILMLSLCLQFFLLASPYYIQLVIDKVILTADVNLLNLIAIGFALILTFEVLTQLVRSLSLIHFNQSLSVQLATNLFHHLIRLPLSYFETRNTGDVISRFNSLQQIKQTLSTGLAEAVIDGLMAIFTLIMLAFYSIKLTVIVVLIATVYATLYSLFYRYYRQICERELVAKAEENSNFIETIKSIQTIKVFGSESKRESLWQNNYVNITNQAIKLGRFKACFDALHRLFFGIENIIVVFIAAHMVIGSGFSTGMLFAFLAYKHQFLIKTSSLIEKSIELKMLSVHFDRLSDIVLTPKEASLSNQDYLQVDGSIELKNVSFRYSHTSPYILKNLNMTIKKGENIAITGQSGCGKSTLLKLMLGLAEVESGEILIDGVPLNQIDKTVYRNQVASVMQDDNVLSGSIIDNITFFDANADLELAKECARLAHIDKDINSMPMGYNTLVGEMGSILSGGQKQRLLLARALYRKPKILFLDEATSHLDVNLEHHINESVQHLEITRIVIAHRPETIMSANRVINLKESMNPREKNNAECA